MLIGVPKEVKPDEYRVAWVSDPALALGVNIVDGHVTYRGVAEAFGLDHSEVQAFLSPAAQA